MVTVYCDSCRMKGIGVSGSLSSRDRNTHGNATAAGAQPHSFAARRGSVNYRVGDSVQLERCWWLWWEWGVRRGNRGCRGWLLQSLSASHPLSVPIRPRDCLKPHSLKIRQFSALSCPVSPDHVTITHVYVFWPMCVHYYNKCLVWRLELICFCLCKLPLVNYHNLECFRSKQWPVDACKITTLACSRNGKNAVDLTQKRGIWGDAIDAFYTS